MNRHQATPTSRSPQVYSPTQYNHFPALTSTPNTQLTMSFTSSDTYNKEDSQNELTKPSVVQNLVSRMISYMSVPAPHRVKVYVPGTLPKRRDFA